MFDLFGEFDSAEELNAAAAGLLAEGDHENIVKLAAENGLDEVFAQGYIEGEIPELTNTLMAAVGKIEVERGGISDPIYDGIKDYIFNFIMSQCQDETFARAVRRKSKCLKACIEHCKAGTKKIVTSQGGSVADRIVYGFAKEYYIG